MIALGERLRVPLMLIIAVVLQTSVLGRFRVAGVRPDILLLVAVAAGMVAGAERGALVGFVAGIVADLFVETPLGLNALTFSLVGFGVGSVQASILRAVWWIAPLTAMAASAAGIVLFALLGFTVGQSHLLSPRVGLVAAVVGAVNAMFSLPVVRLVTWALPADHPGRSYAG